MEQNSVLTSQFAYFSNGYGNSCYKDEINVKGALFIHVFPKCTKPKLRIGLYGLQLKKDSHVPEPELMLSLPWRTHFPNPNTWTKSKWLWFVSWQTKLIICRAWQLIIISHHSFYLHRIFINIFSFFLENKRILLKINYKHNLQISFHPCRKSNR